MATPAVRAETPNTNSSDFTSLDAPAAYNETEPFNLVGLAYQGFFEDQGIPSGDELTTAYRVGEISAEDLSQSAIQAKRLSLDTLNDANYLAAVESQIEGLNSSSSGNN